MPHDISGLIGVGYTRRTATPDFAPGTVTYSNDARSYCYVKATAAINVGTVTVTGTFDATAGAGSYTADVAFAAGEYGFVRKTASPFVAADTSAAVDKEREKEAKEAEVVRDDERGMDPDHRPSRKAAGKGKAKDEPQAKKRGRGKGRGKAAPSHDVPAAGAHNSTAHGVSV